MAVLEQLVGGERDALGAEQGGEALGADGERAARSQPAQEGLEVGHGLARGGGVEGEAGEELLGAGAGDERDLEELGRHVAEIAARLRQDRWDPSEAGVKRIREIGLWAGEEVVQALHRLFDVVRGRAMGEVDDRR